MRERPTARVLLMDGEGRLLLLKGRLPVDPDAPANWFTVGGGAEPGESVREAAAREVLEETGFTDVELGPVVWRRKVVIQDLDGPWLFDESYFVARCAGGEPGREGWLEHELTLLDEMRWWTVAEILASDEVIHPPDLRRLLPDVIAGRYPPEPIVIG